MLFKTIAGQNHFIGQDGTGPLSEDREQLKKIYHETIVWF